MMFGLSAVMLCVFVGAAVDMARWQQAQSRTAAALDAAVLAAGRKLQADSQNPEAALALARTYYDEHLQPRLNVVNEDVNFTYNPDGIIEGRAKADIPTPFLSLGLTDSLRVSAKSNAAFKAGGSGGGDLEVSLMLDVTGSMCDNGIGPCTNSVKLNALKAAAKNLISIVVPDNQTTVKQRVAIVPFSTRVRVGPNQDAATETLMKKLTDLDPTWTGWYDMCVDSSGGGNSETDGDWTCNRYESTHVVNWNIMPCVTDRTGADEFTDKAPGSDAWLNAHGGDRRVKADDSEDTPAVGHLGTVKADPAWHWNYDDTGWCSDIGPQNAVMPLTNQKTALNMRIDGLEAYGATAGALGTAWAWYMISPNWDGIWTGDGKPGPYSDISAVLPSGAKKLRKVAVLMSDGLYNTYRSWKPEDAADEEARSVMVSNNAKQICTNMKAAGVEVFTVGFSLDELTATQRARALDVLQSCGTDVDHFYNSLNEEQLQSAFRDIAMQLSKLHLVE